MPIRERIHVQCGSKKIHKQVNGSISITKKSRKLTIRFGT